MITPTQYDMSTDTEAPKQIEPWSTWSTRDQPEILPEADRSRQLLQEQFMSGFSVSKDELDRIRELDTRHEALSQRIRDNSVDNAKKEFFRQREEYGAGRLKQAESHDSIKRRFKAQKGGARQEMKKLSSEVSAIVGPILKRAAQCYSDAIREADEQERNLFHQWNVERPETGLVPTLRQRARVLQERAARVSRGSEGGKPSALLPGILTIKASSKKRQEKADT